MDFKKLMSAQISKSRPVANGENTSSKYLRRAELEAERQARYVEDQQRLAAEKEERLSKKRKLDEEEAEQNAQRELKLQRLAAESKARREAKELEEEQARRRRLGLPPLPENGAEDPSAVPEGFEDVPDDELRLKLRGLHQPASVFAETHSARLHRYYKLVKKEVSRPQLSKGPIPSTLEPVAERDMLIPDSVPAKDKIDDVKFLYRQLASYFTLLLTEWSIMLSQRDEAIQASASGRAAYASYKIVLSDLTPMYRRMESNTIEADLIPPLFIVLCVYFPKLRYAIFEGDRRYGITEDSEDAQTVSAGTESKVQ
ncbi:uncharacterized protein AB675_8202 [Cyphellophora attinorum]|uniref:Pre-mRNA processing factor 4 (PRP4)-like domain-containing protein n=1 Tax=Cyphellophora attinorum TaxID=1664694 RepID=A0A0N0NNA2_9EURO|nr:uncharacterized protein AB675_8202 [Phialophora attinorum]KPI41288.1 hypothetical protein AB675_8202 [Phialophora attinorum]